MIVKLSKKQTEVITKVRESFRGEIIIYKEGARVVGKSYLISLIPLMTQYRDIIVLTKNFHHLFDMARYQLKDYGLEYNMTIHDYLIRGDNFSIRFTSNPEKVLGYNDAIVIEKPSDFGAESLSYVLARPITKVIIEDPRDCGWRNPLIVKGVHMEDEKGRLLFDKVSWDYNLLLWKPEWNTSSYYKDSIIVVLGDGGRL